MTYSDVGIRFPDIHKFLVFWLNLLWDLVLISLGLVLARQFVVQTCDRILKWDIWSGVVTSFAWLHRILFEIWSVDRFILLEIYFGALVMLLIKTNKIWGRSYRYILPIEWNRIMRFYRTFADIDNTCRFRLFKSHWLKCSSRVFILIIADSGLSSKLLGILFCKLYRFDNFLWFFDIGLHL